MEQSQYLAQALAAMGADAPSATAAPDLSAMKGQADARKAWELANPGQSYAKNLLGNAGKSIMAAPGNAAAGISGLFKLGGT